MYLSGAPLHVITLGLVERFRRARPEVPLSFSAGVDNRNFADCVALGLAPVTVCSDLLKPGGYSRLPKYLENLEARMRGLGVRTVGDFVVKACGTGEAALESAFPPSPLREELLASLRSDRVDLRAVLAAAGQEARYDELVRTAAVLNTPLVVARATSDPRYRAGSLRAAAPHRPAPRALRLRQLRQVPAGLPERRELRLRDGALRAREYESYRVEGGHAVPVAGGRFEVRERHQIGTFQDFCNDCGNCDTFCPEDGGPYLEKPRFFGSLAAFRERGTLDGFCVDVRQAEDAMWGRLRGVEYRLDVDRGVDRAVFTDGRVTLELRHAEREPVGASVAPGTPDGHTLDVGAYLRMAVVLDGVLDPRRANPVNAAVTALVNLLLLAPDEVRDDGTVAPHRPPARARAGGAGSPGGRDAAGGGARREVRDGRGAVGGRRTASSCG